ncbi:unnamed protein product [Durusdinium trenchii]|uniref:SET domain-containing protein n=1 Tax=Durusdinium trenchii TaxID=1381693 RepID=A0ABP0IXP1_9DINO
MPRLSLKDVDLQRLPQQARAALEFLVLLNPREIIPDATAARQPTLLPPQKPEHAGRRTLVLDLDETLVHCHCQQGALPGPHPEIQIELENGEPKAVLRAKVFALDSVRLGSSGLWCRRIRRTTKAATLAQVVFQSLQPPQVAEGISTRPFARRLLLLAAARFEAGEAQLLSLKPGASSSSPEFFGPITVARVPGKHRGLVCARAVRRGELLFANRALAVAETRSLPEVTCQKLRSCSEWDFGAFFLLSDGLHTPHELPKLPQVPREEVENMDQRARDVKKERVKAILSANAHELDTSGGQLSAIFLVASLVNHSCRPSAARVFLGDMMFVRAARDLNAGDEITDGYISVLQPALERRRAIRERYGFELCEDRILVEEHLFSKAAVTELLEKIDNANSLEDFSEILEETQRFVSRQLRSLSDCTAESATCVTAAQRLGCGLERLLLGGLVMPVQVGMATILSHMGRHAEAAKGYCRCCWLMEELAPHNAYHAKWAVEALVEAAKASLPLGDYAAYAQHVLNGHCGPGALEVFLGTSKSILKGLNDPKACSHLCPGEVHISCGISQSSDLELQVDLPLSLKVSDLEISACGFLVDLWLKPLGHFLLALPRTVDPDSATVRLHARRLRARFARPG